MYLINILFYFIFLNMFQIKPISILDRLLLAASATRQPPTTFTFLIILKITGDIILDLLHSQDFEKTLPLIFSRWTFGIRLKIVCCLILELYLPNIKICLPI